VFPRIIKNTVLKVPIKDVQHFTQMI